MKNYLRTQDNFLETFFKEFDQNQHQLGSGLDIYKENNKYFVEMEIPGFSKDEIKIDFKEDVLEISATKENQEEKSEKEYYFKQRQQQSFKQKIRFSDVKQDEIEAEYSNGVLKLVLPIEIPVEAQPRQIKIK